MNPVKAAIRQIIVDDDILCGSSGLLAVSEHPLDTNETESRKNSVIDYLYLDKAKMPCITIKADDDINVAAGEAPVLDAFVQIRCYNGRDRTFFTVNEVLSRVRQLLNGTVLDLGEQFAQVETRYELTRPELTDEAVNLNFRESQFRTRYL